MEVDLPSYLFLVFPSPPSSFPRLPTFFQLPVAPSRFLPIPPRFLRHLSHADGQCKGTHTPESKVFAQRRISEIRTHKRRRRGCPKHERRSTQVTVLEINPQIKGCCVCSTFVLPEIFPLLVVFFVFLSFVCLSSVFSFVSVFYFFFFLRSYFWVCFFCCFVFVIRLSRVCLCCSFI